MVRLKGKLIDTLVSDVDGVLTNGVYYYTARGVLLKGFHCHDMVAARSFKDNGVKVVLVTSGNPAATKITERRVMDMAHEGVTLVQAPFRLKVDALNKAGIRWEKTAYIGDCLDDLPAFKKAAVSIAPASAPRTVREAASMLLSTKGGEGCWLEIVEQMVYVNEG